MADELEFKIAENPNWLKIACIFRESGLPYNECERIFNENPTKGIVGNLELLLQTRKSELSEQGITNITSIVNRYKNV